MAIDALDQTICPLIKAMKDTKDRVREYEDYDERQINHEIVTDLLDRIERQSS